MGYSPLWEFASEALVTVTNITDADGQAQVQMTIKGLASQLVITNWGAGTLFVKLSTTDLSATEIATNGSGAVIIPPSDSRQFDVSPGQAYYIRLRAAQTTTTNASLEQGYIT